MGLENSQTGALVGKRLGKFDILALLAIGGTAEIYLARIGGEAGFEKYVVVKCLLDHLADDAEFIRMFLDEARIAAQLDHSNIVQTLELGEQNGRYFMGMEYLVGMSLAQMARKTQERVPGGLIPVDLVLGLAAQTCAGLHYAHERIAMDGKPLNLVHRDISPQNLVISYEGILKIVDFGIAKADARETQTRAGTIKGKFAYMSPEQAMAKDLDRRTDVFALGVIVHELLTARRLFKRQTTYETYQAIVNAKVPTPSSVNHRLDPSLDDLVMNALHFEKERRYPTAQAFGEKILETLHKRGKSVSASNVAEYFDQFFEKEIDEHSARMRELVEGRAATSVEETQWDSVEAVNDQKIQRKRDSNEEPPDDNSTRIEMNPLGQDEDDFAESATLVRDDDVVQKALANSGLPPEVINPAGKKKKAPSAKQTLTLQPNRLGKLPALKPLKPPGGPPLKPPGGPPLKPPDLRIPSPSEVAAGKRGGRGLALSMPSGSSAPYETLAGSIKAKRKTGENIPASSPEAATILNIEFEEKQREQDSKSPPGGKIGDSIGGPTMVDDMDFDMGMEPSKTTTPGGPKAAAMRERAKRDVPQHKGISPSHTPVPELTSRPAGNSGGGAGMGNVTPQATPTPTGVPVSSMGHKIQSGPASKPSGIEFRTPAGLKQLKADKAAAPAAMPGTSGPGAMPGGPGAMPSSGPGAMPGGPGAMPSGPGQMPLGPTLPMGLQGASSPAQAPGGSQNFPVITTPTAVKNLGQAVQPQPITALPGGDALILAQERTLSAGPATWLVAVVFLISVGAGLALSMLIFR